MLRSYSFDGKVAIRAKFFYFLLFCDKWTIHKKGELCLKSTFIYFSDGNTVIYVDEKSNDSISDKKG